MHTSYAGEEVEVELEERRVKSQSLHGGPRQLIK